MQQRYKQIYKETRKKHTITMKTKKTTIAFTAKEIEIIDAALNHYAVDQMNKSKTWSSTEEYIAHGGPDIWHRNADKTVTLQIRFFRAKDRLEAK